MKLTLLATTALAVVLVLGLGRASAAPTDSSSIATGRRLLHSSTTTSHTKPMDSWLRWLLIRSRFGDKDKNKNGAAILQLARAAELNSPKQQQKINLQANSSSDEETAVVGDEDFADEDLQLLMPEGRQASKRQPDDYGHMRYGKRDFDDYGHMRFGRR